MDQNQRLKDLEVALRTAIEGHQAGVWTAMPAVVTKYDADAMTCELQVSVQERWVDQTGSVQWVNLPPLINVPVVFQGGGGFTLTFPVKPGDEALVVFASRCIDGWWQYGGGTVGETPQRAPDIRFHNLSDGFAIIGPRSQVRLLGGLSTTSVQLRSDDGATFIEVADGQVVNVTAPGGISLNTDGDIVMTAGGKITGTADDNVELTSTGADITMAASNGSITGTANDVSFTAESGNVTLTSPAVVAVVAPSTTISGAVGFGTGGAGPFNATVNGTLTLTQGNVVLATGSVTATAGNVTATGKSLLTHKHHQGNDSGGSTEQDTGVAF